MKRLAQLIVIFWISLAGTAGHAEQVSADRLNCRDRPAADARIVAKLSRGQSVTVSEAGGGWSHVVSPKCWVLARYLSADRVGDSPVRQGSYSASRRQSYASPSYFSSSRRSITKPRKASSSSSRSRSTGRRESRSSGSFGSGCPCSGGNVCIGPRGGRYCITSGGNKRYGI